MNPRWNERLFSSPPNAVSSAIITIPIAKMVMPNALNSVNIVSSKLFNELNNSFHHLSKTFRLQKYTYNVPTGMLYVHYTLFKV